MKGTGCQKDRFPESPILLSKAAALHMYWRMSPPPGKAAIDIIIVFTIFEIML